MPLSFLAPLVGLYGSFFDLLIFDEGLEHAAWTRLFSPMQGVCLVVHLHHAASSAISWVLRLEHKELLRSVCTVLWYLPSGTYLAQERAVLDRKGARRDVIQSDRTCLTLRYTTFLTFLALITSTTPAESNWHKWMRAGCRVKYPSVSALIVHVPHRPSQCPSISRSATRHLDNSFRGADPHIIKQRNR